jgi:hypothetical protein
MGIRIPETFIVAERAALPDEQFGRERLGLWADRNDRAAIDLDAWRRLADPTATRGQFPVFGIAVAPDRSWSAVAAAWRDSEGFAQVSLTEHGYQPDATWIPGHYSALQDRAPGCRVAVDAAARGLIDEAVQPSMAEQAQADNMLADAVLAGAVRHGNDPALDMAVRSARWKPSGDTRVLDRKGSRDISPLRAAALALWLLETHPAYDVLESVR